MRLPSRRTHNFDQNFSTSIKTSKNWLQKYDVQSGTVNGFKQIIMSQTLCHWLSLSYKRGKIQLIFNKSKHQSPLAIKIWISFWSSSLFLLFWERLQLTILVGIDLEIMWINWDKNTKMHICITLKCSDISANMTNEHIKNFWNSFEANTNSLLTIAWHLAPFTSMNLAG